MGLRDLVYRLYERRLAAALSPDAIPRHVGVMCDGNRRWARSAGFRDVNKGHRKGADKIFELLDWCRESGVEVVTLWLLSTDNLTRSSTELVPLLKIIEDTVQGLVAEEWHLNPVGALDLLPTSTAQKLKAAEEATRRGDHRRGLSPHRVGDRHHELVRGDHQPAFLAPVVLLRRAQVSTYLVGSGV